ncbi:MAG: polyprenol phosphomannose-dependent alpha 1,6 mannosyltransferase MptB, partial [Rhodococcus fascians]
MSPVQGSAPSEKPGDSTVSSTASSSGAAGDSRVRHLASFLRSPEGHAAVLGVVGAALITFGGFGAGSVRRRDPLLEAMHLSWLRFGHGLILSSILVWVGVLLMIVAWVRLGRATLGGRTSLRELRWVVPAWTAPLLLAVPMFSRDAYSYLAQGALLRDG